ncbi:MAG: MarR family transcriptional regulator [Peptococcaceae bacterium]|nr:MarR family transcriptional regulator [Peptococcaceae bacterium]
MGSFTEFLCFKIGAAARKIYKYYNAEFAQYGITIAQSFIIFSLLENNGQNIKNLADRLNLDSSAITGLVDRLEKENLVERQVDPEDRRAFRVLLTEKGKGLAEKIFPVAEEFNEKLKTGLTKEEQEALASFVGKVDEFLV